MALLEREEEAAAIEAVLDAAQRGEGGLLLIEGEAGAGKTSLLTLAIERGRERGMLVLRSRGGENERDFAYGVIRQLFEAHLAGSSSEETFDGAAGLCEPIFDLSTDRGSTDRLALQHGLYWLAADIAAGRPLLITLDDAHWADTPSLQALGYIAHRLEDLPMALLYAARTGEPDCPYELIDGVRDEPRARVLEPEGLSREAVVGLGREQLGPQADEEFLLACHAACDGNPFLLGELLRGLADSRITPTRENAGEVAEHAAQGAARSILARLHRLPSDAVEVARAVAVLEQSAAAEHVAAVAGIGRGEMVEAGEHLIEAHLLNDGWPMSFVHPLIRSAVYDEISVARRATLHRRAADCLTSSGAPADATAAHLIRVPPAGDAAVVAGLRAAAADARARGAPDASVTYLRRAMEEPPTQEEALGVRRELGSALLEAADPSGIDELLAVRSALGDPLQRAELAAEVAPSLNLRGRAEEGRAVVEASLAELDHDSERESVRRLEAAHVVSTALMGDGAITHEAATELVGPIAGRTIGERGVLTSVDILLAAGLGRIDEAVAVAERVVADRDALVADARAGFARGNSAVTLALADQTDRALAILDGQLEACRSRGSATSVGIMSSYRALVHQMRGSLADALLEADLAASLLRQTGLGATWPVGAVAWLLARLGRGDIDGADEMLVSLGLDGVPPPGLAGAALLCARGELRLAQGRSEDGRDDFRLARDAIPWLPLANPEVCGWRTGLARAEHALGNTDQASVFAAEAVERAREAGGKRGVAIALRVAGVVTGGSEGIDLLSDSARLASQTSGALLHAAALVELGAALRRANRRKQARDPLRDGLELAHRCGAAPLEERARTELAATGARPRSAVRSGTESLTPSEMRVAKLASSGMTNREIAQELYVTTKTVEYHLRHCYQKLEIQGRGELAGALTA